MGKIFVSGCFDLLHTGHIAFLQEAATYGELYVAIASDKTIINLKGTPPLTNERERLYAVKSLKCVHDGFIASGSGILNFEYEFHQIKPNILIVNEDGNSNVKRELCEKMGIKYLILKREPHTGLPRRSTTSLRSQCNIPYRLDLAGGWLDQPFVSKYHPGSVITLCIEPGIQFNNRSGMASSTRNHAIELWGMNLPYGDIEKIAKILFCYDNPPGTIEISGSQDSIGIVYPNLNKLDYNGTYWPHTINPINDRKYIDMLENSIYMIPLDPRPLEYTVINNININEIYTKELSIASNECWNAIMSLDIQKFGHFVRKSFEAQIKMFPNMINNTIMEQVHKYTGDCMGWKISGAGGGGYLILISDHTIDNTIKIKVRHEYL